MNIILFRLKKYIAKFSLVWQEERDALNPASVVTPSALLTFPHPLRATVSAPKAHILPEEKAGKYQRSSMGTQVRAGDFLKILWRNLQNRLP